MFRKISLPLLLSSAVALLVSVPGPAQKPEEPLGELLDVIPLPGKPASDAPSAEDAPMQAPPPPRHPIVAPGTVVPVDLPPSSIMDDPQPVGTTEPETGEPPPDISAASSTDLGPEAETNVDDEAKADAAWAALQERRRQEINAVESPIVEQLNAEGAARAEAATRQIEEERAAYERSLIEAEEEARRVAAEHDAAMAAHARRVAEEQAEYRARVAACLDGDRRACRPQEKR